MSKDKVKKYGSAYIPDAPKEVRRRGSGGGDDKIAEIEKSVEAIRDSLAKSNRDNQDAMYNIDMDNLSTSMRRMLASYGDGIVSARAEIKTWADSQQAGFDAVAEWQESADKSITGLKSTTASIQSTANTQGAAIQQIVSAVGADGKVNAASIVAAINAQTGESVVKIDADKVKIDNLYTKEVKLNTDSGDYTMITSSLVNSNATVHVGVQEYPKDADWAQFTYFHGDAFTFLPPGSWNDSKQTYYNKKMLSINMMYLDPIKGNTTLAIVPASDGSYLGVEEYPFGQVHASEFVFGDSDGNRGSLYVTTKGELRFFPDANDTSTYRVIAFE